MMVPLLRAEGRWPPSFCCALRFFRRALQQVDQISNLAAKKFEKQNFYFHF